jgi:Domain of unknown function (DUF4259)
MRTQFSLLFVLFLFATAHTFAGAWGHRSFENDDALDWVTDDLKSAPQRAINDAIATIIRSKGYLEAPQCSIAIAACEVIAAVQGRPSSDLPEDVAAAVKTLGSKQSETLRRDARDALDKILAKSELRDLWEESKHFEEWKKSVAELKSRL